MNWKRGLGMGLIFIGTYLILTNAFLTGAVIGFRRENLLSIAGVFVVVVGLVMLLSKTLDKRVKEELEFREPGGDPDLIYQRPGYATRERNIPLGGNEAHNAANYNRMKKNYAVIGQRVPGRQYIRMYGLPPDISRDTGWVTLYHGDVRGIRAEGRIGSNGKFIGTKKIRGGGLYLHDNPRAVVEEFPSYTLEQLKIVKIRVAKNVYDALDLRRKNSQLATQPNDSRPSKSYILPNKKIKLANKLFEEGYIKLESLK